MSLKDFTKEKIASAIKSGAKEIGVETAVFSAIKLIDHKNEANSLSEKARKSQSETKNSVSTESFFSESANPIIRLTMKEKIMSLRKHYVIQDNLGNIVFTVKSEGFLGGPKLGLYDVNEQKIGLVEKHSSNNPAYSLYFKEKKIASLHRKSTLIPKYDIPENGWYLECGILKADVYDSRNAHSIQIHFSLSDSSPDATIEYTNKENEFPAILITLAMTIFFLMN